MSLREIAEFKEPKFAPAAEWAIMNVRISAWSCAGILKVVQPAL
jgi:hypothetical protein